MIAKYNPTRSMRTIHKLWRKQQMYRAHPSQARSTSTYVIGAPGTGKSKFLESLFIQDVRQGRPVGLIDIHGDLYQHVLANVAALAHKHPSLAQRVIIIDPTQPTVTTTINPLEAIAGMSQERTALFFTDIVIKIWNISPNESPRLVWLLTNAFLALANLGLSLGDFPRWLQDRDWRDQMTQNISHEAVRRYWENEFPRSDKEARVWIGPATNKLGGILFDSEVRNILTGSNQITMRQIMEQGLILLVHIPKGIVGENSARLLAAFVVAQVQKAALSRADTKVRKQYILYLDEYQNYTTSYIQDVLAESRKYSLSLVLAHQYLDQLDVEMRSSVLNTSGMLVSFGIGYQDARALAQQIFPRPDFPLYRGDIELGSWEKLALELSNLPPRTFWARRRGPYEPTKKYTLDMPDPPDSPQMEVAIQRLLHNAGQRYRRAAVESNTQTSDIVVARSESNSHNTTGHQGGNDDANNLFSDIIWDK